MSEVYFELDHIYPGGYPIGMNPDGEKYFDQNPEYSELLNEWEPELPPLSGLVKNTVGNSCVGLSKSLLFS